jgi:hypothetical protein
VDQYFEALAEAMPDDPAAQFNLAALRAWSADTDVASAAAEQLRQLCAQSEVQVRAALQCLQLAAKTGTPAAIDQEVAFLVGTFDPGQRDQPLVKSDPDFPPGWGQLRTLLKAVAARDVSNAALLARWLAEVGMGREALLWLNTQPDDFLASPQLTTTLCDLVAINNGLEPLREFLASGRMGAIPAQTIPLLLASRVQALEFGGQRARPTWEDAVKTSERSLDGLVALVRLADLWRDHAGRNLALRKIVELYPAEYWACQALLIDRAMSDDAEELWQLYQIWAPRVPENQEVQAEWIMLAVILNRVGPEHMARVDQLWTRVADPVDPALVLATVGAVWRSDSAEVAERYMERLPVEAEGDARTLLWRAILSAENDNERTLQYALRTLKRDALLTDESVLLDRVLEAKEQRQRMEEMRRRETTTGGP